MSTEKREDETSLERRIGSAEGVFYSGFATSLMDKLGEVVIIGKDLNELIQRWYSMTDIKLDIGRVMPVAIFKADAIKLKDPGDSESVKPSASE